MSDQINILDACEDENLFGSFFRDRDTWAAWRAFMAALFGLPMSDDLASHYRERTGRNDLPTAPSSEAWLVVGRRGGKSFVLALIAVFLSVFRDYRPFLAPGERATVAIIAADRKQARTIFRYIKGLLHAVPMLKRLIERETADAFDLSGSVTIEVSTASFRTTRGYTFAAILADEVAFWPAEDSAEPDHAILAAVRPGMATIPGAMLLCASSPYARRGALFEAWRDWYGKEGGPLVWHGPTRAMNPTVPQDLIDKEMKRDPANALAEFMAEFRKDVEAVFSMDAVEAVTSAEVRERPRRESFRHFAFVDPSGGSSDSMTLAIAHNEKGKAVLDLVREVRPPFSPDAVAKEFADTAKLYGVREVTGDRYAGEWPRERFRAHGVTYQLAKAPRSELYLHMLSAVNSGQVDLLDLPRLKNQMVGLERRVNRSGRETIDHGPGGHDDVANAAAGALWLAERANRTEGVPLVGTSGWHGDASSLCGSATLGGDESVRSPVFIKDEPSFGFFVG